MSDQENRRSASSKSKQVNSNNEDHVDRQHQRNNSGGSEKRAPKRIPAKLGEDPTDQMSQGDQQNHELQLQETRTESRKGSFVSFQKTCDLYELDLERGERNKQLIRRKPAALKSVRYYIILLALMSPFVVTYSRTIINFALTDMIDPEYLARQHNGHMQAGNGSTETDAYFDVDNSCPVNEETRARLLSENKIDTERAKTLPGEKFQWDTFKQGLLKAAYAFGHAPLQIPGGRMSEIYGSHLIMSLSSLLIAICCLAAPYMAALNFYLLFADLVLLGVLGSFMTPALITLFSNWLTPSEKSLTISFYLIASRLGYALSSVLCGLLIQAQLSWRYVFFSAGWISITFASLFFLCARSRPVDHPFVSQLELDFLASKNRLVRESSTKTNSGGQTKAKPTEMKPVESDAEQDDQSKISAQKEAKKQAGAPWLAILTSMPVWAFIVTKFCVKLAGDTVQIELPTYLKRVMHFSAKNNGLLNAWNYVIFCAGCFVVGALSKVLIKRRPFGLSKTAIRKMFQCTASFGVSLCLLGLAFSVCDDLTTNILLMLIFAVTTFGTGGEAQIPLDITERYPGTIHALASSIALSGAIEPTLVGFFLKGHAADRDSWKGVWLGASAIAFTGGLFFLIFADATIQPFDSINTDVSESSDASGETKSENNKPKGNDNKAFVTDEQTNEAPVDTQPKEDCDDIYQESREI